MTEEHRRLTREISDLWPLVSLDGTYSKAEIDKRSAADYRAGMELACAARYLTASMTLPEIIAKMVADRQAQLDSFITNAERNQAEKVLQERFDAAEAAVAEWLAVDAIVHNGSGPVLTRLALSSRVR